MKRELSPNEKRVRAIALVLLPATLLLLRAVPPSATARWLPFPTSCGAFTGLPCIFCGTTRALHFLLNGNWRSALYFNWLSFPLVAGAAMLFLTLLLELLLDRNLLSRLPKFRLTRLSFAGTLTALLLLWVLQVYLAVSRHKTELLNPKGPLYSLVVR
ncbi:MAG TPA: DUF2752 domain-containing protein [Chthoniobacterales bacterium]